MAIFFRYLMSLAMQMAWQRAGKGGALPPVRMPIGKNNGKSMPLPIIGPWQMMMAMWIARQVWGVYGHQVKSRLQSTSNPLVNHVGNLLPDTPHKGKAASSAPSSAPAASPPQQGAATRPAAQYGTQPLSTSDDSDSGKLTPGSVLDSLRSTK